MIVLDAREMTDKEKTHIYLHAKLGLPSYYGGNLDALWDELSSWHEPRHIILINHTALREYLGHYGDLLLAVFNEAMKSNDNLRFEMV